MRIYPRGKYWWCSWTENGITVKRSTRCTTKAAAQAVAARWERERADPAHAAANAATFEVEAQTFLADLRRRKKGPDTMNMYECKVGHLVRLMPRAMGQLDVHAVDAYFLERSDEGASGSTLYKEWVALRGVLRTAARRRHFVGDIGVLKPVWVTPSYVPRKRHLSWAQLGLLLDELAPAVPKHLADMERACAVAFLVGAGPRRSEFRRAQAEDIDVTAWTVRMRGTKTQKAATTIPVPPPYRDLILAASVYLSATKGGRFHPWGNARRDLAAAAERIGRRLAKAADADPDTWATFFAPVTFNDLRRSFASLLVQGGVSNKVVADLMRHATTAMVDLVYGQQTTDSLGMLVDAQTADMKGGRDGE